MTSVTVVRPVVDISATESQCDNLRQLLYLVSQSHYAILHRSVEGGEFYKLFDEHYICSD